METKDDGRRENGPKRCFRFVERHNLGINARLAHAPGDELGHLAAEIDDEDSVLRRHGAG